MAEQSPEQAIVHSRNVAGGSLVVEPNLMQVGSIFHLRSFGAGEVHSSLAQAPLVHGRVVPTSSTMKHSLLQTASIVHERVIQLSAARWASGEYIRSDTPAYPIRLVDRGDDSIVTFQASADGDLELAGDLTLTGGGTIRTAPTGYRAEMSAGSYPFRYFDDSAPVYVQKVESVSASATTRTPTFGATATAGNLIVLVAAADETVTGTRGMTAGGSLIAMTSSVANNIRTRMWWKVSDGTETAFTVTSSPAGPIATALYEYDAAHTAQLDRTVANQSSAGATSVTITDSLPVVSENVVELAFVASRAASHSTPTTGWVERTDVGSGGTNPVRIAVYEKVPAAEGDIIDITVQFPTSVASMRRAASFHGGDTRFQVDTVGTVTAKSLVLQQKDDTSEALRIEVDPTSGVNTEVVKLIGATGLTLFSIDEVGLTTVKGGLRIYNGPTDAYESVAFTSAAVWLGEGTSPAGAALRWDPASSSTYFQSKITWPDAPGSGGDKGSLGAGGDISLKERTAPSTPAANWAVIYVKDKAGVSNLYWKSDAGTEYDLSATGGGGAHDHTTADGSGVLTNDEHDGYMELAQIASPSTPASNKIRIYAKDDGGTAKMFVKREDGVEVGPYAGTNIINTWTAEQQYLGSGTTAQMLSSKATGDANDRFRLRADGRLIWGDGTASPDAGLEWSAANVLKMLTGDSLLVGTTLRLDTGDFIEAGEVSAPATPAADKVRLYTRPRGNATGLSRLEYKDAAGAVRDLAGSAYVAGPVTADVTISNSATETDLLSYTIPANDLEVGATYHLILSGTIDNIATSGTLTIALKVGTTLIENIVLATQASAKTDSPFWVEGILTCRTTGGSGTVHGAFFQRNSFTSSATSVQSVAPVTVDTTAAQSVKVTAKFQTANAGNIFRLFMGYIERVK